LTVPCNVHAIAEDVIALGDYVSEVDPDAEFDPSFWWARRLSLANSPLHFDRAAHGINNAGELGEEAVSGVLDDPAVVLGDLRVDQLPEVRLQAFVGAPPHPPPSGANIGPRRRRGSR
jgi:hypothetical protein